MTHASEFSILDYLLKSMRIMAYLKTGKYAYFDTIIKQASYRQVVVEKGARETVDQANEV